MAIVNDLANITTHLSLPKSEYLAPMKRAALISLLGLFFFTVNTNAQSGGQHVYDFINLPVSARLVALGGSVISARDHDLNLALQNPALLDTSMHHALALTYLDYLAGVQSGNAAYSYSHEKAGTFGVSIQYLNYGKFTQAEANGVITGNFTGSDQAYSLSWSRPIDTIFRIGASLKTIYSALGEYTSVGNLIEAGGIYHRASRKFTAALVISGPGVQWKSYNGTKEKMPFEIKAGITKKVRHAPFRLNFTFQHLEKWDLTYVDPAVNTVDPLTGEEIKKSGLSRLSDKLARHVIFGGEIILSKNFYVGVGYNYLRRKEMLIDSRPGIVGFSFGFGLRISKFNFSYGYSKYHLAGGPNHFTISTRISDFYSRKN